MNKTKFFAQRGDSLVIAQEDNPEYGDYLFLMNRRKIKNSECRVEKAI